MRHRNAVLEWPAATQGVRYALRALRYLLARVWPARLSEGEKAFIAANRTLWTNYAPSIGRAPGFVLVEPQFHPIILHSNASFGAIVAWARGLTPLFLLESRAQKSVRAILSSYPGARFVYMDSWRYVLPWLVAWTRAGRAYRGLRSPADILDLAADGMRFGDLIYDALLAPGYARVKRIDFVTLLTLQRFYTYRAIIEDIAKRNDVRAYVSAHGYIGLRNGTFTRYLLRRRIEVLNRLGSYQLIVRKYRTTEDVGVYALRPTDAYLRLLLDEYPELTAQLAHQYLEERFSQAIDDVAVSRAFSRGKQLFTTTGDFAAAYGLDESKPLVFVMLHAFTDYPHSHFRRKLMFQDYYDWFIETLRIARSDRSANWIFKEHPAADFYPTKDLDLAALFAAERSAHIRFLDRDADFNSISLRHLAHAVVTCIGTAGMEYSCVGIPCVLGGESPYSGFGFTVEPRDRDEYRRVLQRIADLGRLHPDQILRAKAVTWFELALMQEIPYALCPRYSYQQIKSIRSDAFWSDVAGLVRTLAPNAIRGQFEMVAEFLRADGYVQLVNLEKYPFLRAGAGLPEK